MHSVHRPHTTAFERLCESFCFIIDFKALTGKCQHSHDFVSTYFIWNATEFIFKRLRTQQRQIACLNECQDCQNRLSFNSNSWLRLVIKRTL